VLHATYAISPNVVNEVAFNYNGNNINVTPEGIYQRTYDEGTGVAVNDVLD
jgi:hypothetical protein